MKIKRIFFICCLLPLLLIIFIFFQLLTYHFTIREYQKSILLCTQNKQMYDDAGTQTEIKAVYDKNSCFCRMYSLLAPRLLEYDGFYNGKKLRFLRVSDNDFIPDFIFNISDAIISFGSNVLPPEDIKTAFDKKIYAYICKTTDIEDRQDNVKYYNKCLVGNQQYSALTRKENNISFDEMLKTTFLSSSGIFLIIEFPETDKNALRDILSHSGNITGITVKLRNENSQYFPEYINCLKEIEKNFVLVMRTPNVYRPCVVGAKCKYTGNLFGEQIFLTYINKELISKKRLLFNKRDYNKMDTNSPSEHKSVVPVINIDKRVVLYEKIKNIIRNSN